MCGDSQHDGLEGGVRRGLEHHGVACQQRRHHFRQIQKVRVIVGCDGGHHTHRFAHDERRSHCRCPPVPASIPAPAHARRHARPRPDNSGSASSECRTDVRVHWTSRRPLPPRSGRRCARHSPSTRQIPSPALRHGRGCVEGARAHDRRRCAQPESRPARPRGRRPARRRWTLRSPD